METQKHRDTETEKHGDTEADIQGDRETESSRNAETGRQRHGDRETWRHRGRERERHGDKDLRGNVITGLFSVPLLNFNVTETKLFPKSKFFLLPPLIITACYMKRPRVV
jgi:hypothetical protein